MFQFQHSQTSPLGRMTLTGFGMRQRVSLREPRVFGQYAVVLLIDGVGSYWDANGREAQLEAGDLILVFPELAHFYNPSPGTEWICSYLCFEGPVFDLWRETGLLDSRRPVHRLRPVGYWTRRMDRVVGDAGQTGVAPALLEVCRLQEFLAEALSGVGAPGGYADDLDWVHRAGRLIETGIGQPVNWEALAVQLGASLTSFRKRFARLSGQPPAHYRMARQIDRACELMQEGRLNDRQIAERLGFCDEYYFSRRFKRITGKPPREFRRALALDRQKNSFG